MENRVIFNEAEFYLAAKDVFRKYTSLQKEGSSEIPDNSGIKAKPVQMDKEYLSTDEVAAYLGYEKSTIYQYVNKKVIPFKKKNNGKLLFALKEIRDWIENKE